MPRTRSYLAVLLAGVLAGVAGTVTVSATRRNSAEPTTRTRLIRAWAPVPPTDREAGPYGFGLVILSYKGCGTNHTFDHAVVTETPSTVSVKVYFHDSTTVYWRSTVDREPFACGAERTTPTDIWVSLEAPLRDRKIVGGCPPTAPFTRNPPKVEFDCHDLTAAASTKNAKPSNPPAFPLALALATPRTTNAETGIKFRVVTDVPAKELLVSRAYLQQAGVMVQRLDGTPQGDHLSTRLGAWGYGPWLYRAKGAPAGAYDLCLTGYWRPAGTKGYFEDRGAVEACTPIEVTAA